MYGNVWRILVEPGQPVKAGEVLVIVEAMKMEMQVKAPRDGVVKAVQCRTGTPVATGDALIYLEHSVQ
jgi:urea carboxylase